MTSSREQLEQLQDRHIDTQSVWKCFFTHRTFYGPQPQIVSRRFLLALLSINNYDERTRAALVLDVTNKPTLVIGRRRLTRRRQSLETHVRGEDRTSVRTVEYSEHHWEQHMELSVKRITASRLVNSSMGYVRGVPQIGVIFPYIERPVDREYEITPAGREMLDRWRAELAQEAAS